MKKIFCDNPYQHTLHTSVASIDGVEVIFNETIAYSFAGGQESDKATVNGIPILNSRREENLIYYTLPEDHGLTLGNPVTMVIDWARRNKLMRLHFAAEIILEIVYQHFHLEKVGAHIAEHKSRIDFKCDENISQHFDAIVAIYNEIIKNDYPIEKGWDDIKNQRRYWKIEGFAKVQCGGTHVNTTSEVGYVKLKRERPGKGIERIEIRLLDESTPPAS
ncbi:alanyl-tRNA editing protein [Candidatus Dependentiae bacterium]|nr:alanyl-tRNA editing protein [Candidatus Dependentiae bacterium]